MAASVNKVMLLGYLGKDPEVRFTQGGKAVANFSLATDESYKNSDGEKVKRTEWHNIVVWGNSVDNFVQPYLHKGDLVYLEGKLQPRTWEDKERQKRYTTEINTTDIKKLSRDDDGQQNNKPQTRSNRTTSRPAQDNSVEAVSTTEVRDEDIPF